MSRFEYEKIDIYKDEKPKQVKFEKIDLYKKEETQGRDRRIVLDYATLEDYAVQRREALEKREEARKEGKSVVGSCDAAVAGFRESLTKLVEDLAKAWLENPPSRPYYPQYAPRPAEVTSNTITLTGNSSGYQIPHVITTSAVSTGRFYPATVGHPEGARCVLCDGEYERKAYRNLQEALPEFDFYWEDGEIKTKIGDKELFFSVDTEREIPILWMGSVDEDNLAESVIIVPWENPDPDDDVDSEAVGFHNEADWEPQNLRRTVLRAMREEVKDRLEEIRIYETFLGQFKEEEE